MIVKTNYNTIIDAPGNYELVETESSCFWDLDGIIIDRLNVWCRITKDNETGEKVYVESPHTLAHNYLNKNARPVKISREAIESILKTCTGMPELGCGDD